MQTLNIKSRFVLPSLVVLLLCVVYGPYIAAGGSFMADDWMHQVQAYFSRGLWDNYRHWLTDGGGGMRPVSSFFFAVTPRLFGNNPVGYVLLNSSCWIGAVFIMARILKQYIGVHHSLLFFILASIPTISSTTIFSPLTMLIGTSAILFWALSLWCMEYSSHNENKRRWYWIGLGILLVGLLCYEVIAPLLLISIGLPAFAYLFRHGKTFQNTKQALILYALPVVGVVVLVGLFQRLIVPFYGAQTSRLGIVAGFGDMARSFGRWLYSLCVDMPVMLLSAPGHYEWKNSLYPGIVLLIVLSVLFGIVWSLRLQSEERKTPIIPYPVFLVLVLSSLLACSSLSVLSGFQARIEGLENRFLGSAWLLLCVLFVILAAKLPVIPRAIYTSILIILVGLSFIIQSFNYLDNRKLQQAAHADCINQLQQANAQHGAFVVGNVPIYATNNFNNEVVFAYKHDWGGGLRLYTNGFIRGGQVVNLNRIAPTQDSTRFFAALQGDTLLVGNLTGIQRIPVDSSLWFYEYDQYTGTSQLYQPGTAQALHSLFEQRRTGMVNAAKLPVTERFRNWIKHLLH